MEKVKKSRLLWIVIVVVAVVVAAWISLGEGLSGQLPFNEPFNLNAINDCGWISTDATDPTRSPACLGPCPKNETCSAVPNGECKCIPVGSLEHNVLPNE